VHLDFLNSFFPRRKPLQINKQKKGRTSKKRSQKRNCDLFYREKKRKTANREENESVLKRRAKLYKKMRKKVTKGKLRPFFYNLKTEYEIQRGEQG